MNVSTDSITSPRIVRANCTRLSNNTIRRGYLTAFQFLKIEVAAEMMQLHEYTVGYKFGHVIKVRIDSVNLVNTRKFKKDVCFTGGNDRTIYSTRAGFVSIQNIWRNNLNCPLHHVDTCNDWNILVKRCESYKIWSSSTCGHWVIPVTLRHGLFPYRCPHIATKLTSKFI